MSYALHQGDTLSVLRTLPEASVHCVVTSPPYWRMRRYLPFNSPDAHLELGHEPTIGAHIDRLVQIFCEVKRVLRPDGVCWLNYGDSYASDGGRGLNRSMLRVGRSHQQCNPEGGTVPDGLKPKDLLLLPHRVAIALQEDGWWVRGDNIWAKRTPMPESVRDRPIRSHEYVFLLAKAEQYFYDWFAVREPTTGNAHTRGSNGVNPKARLLNFHRRDGVIRQNESFSAAVRHRVQKRNLRSVWHLSAQPFKGLHFATFPLRLAETCILSGTSAHGACAMCGAPWRRNVLTAPRGDWHPDKVLKKAGIARNDKTAKAGGSHDNPFVEPEHIGWLPTCPCEFGVVPCTVLDPFAGAGTAGLAALRNGRQFIGIELNPEYVQMAQQRFEAERWLWAKLFASKRDLGVGTALST